MEEEDRDLRALLPQERTPTMRAVLSEMRDHANLVVAQAPIVDQAVPAPIGKKKKASKKKPPKKAAVAVVESESITASQVEPATKVEPKIEPMELVPGIWSPPNFIQGCSPMPLYSPPMPGAPWCQFHHYRKWLHLKTDQLNITKSGGTYQHGMH